MRFHFVATRILEPWDWKTPDRTGIGNSETSQVEMSERLARRGHEVTSYCLLKKGSTSPAGVKWRHIDMCKFKEPGVWLLYRCPDQLERFPLKHPDQQLWLVVQDTFFVLTDQQAQTVDRIVCLCEAQAREQRRQSPNAADKVVVSSNGLRVDMIEAVEKAGIPDRNPVRIHFSSSPDRGLKVLLSSIFPKAKEYIPELELHVYYGWNNIEKLLKMGDEEAQARAKRFFGPNMEETKALLNQPGVFWHGRIGQRDLTREWLKAGLWVFPSTYPESSCATCMEAQALGAIPIAISLWAVGENVQWGTLIEGDPNDALIQARYAAELVRLAQQAQTGQLEPYRQQMMADARQRFDWDRWVTQWERWL